MVTEGPAPGAGPSVSPWLLAGHRRVGRVCVLIVERDVGAVAVRDGRAADGRWRLDASGRAGAGEKIRVAGVAPERMRLGVGRQAGVVTPEGAESVRLRELGRRGHRRVR